MKSMLVSMQSPHRALSQTPTKTKIGWLQPKKSTVVEATKSQTLKLRFLCIYSFDYRYLGFFAKLRRSEKRWCQAWWGLEHISESWFLVGMLYDFLKNELLNFWSDEVDIKLIVFASLTAFQNIIKNQNP